jgi:hypothetical protein
MRQSNQQQRVPDPSPAPSAAWALLENTMPTRPWIVRIPNRLLGSLEYWFRDRKPRFADRNTAGLINILLLPGRRALS